MIIAYTDVAHSGVGQGGPLGPTLYKFFKLAVTTAMHKRKDEIWPGGLKFWVAHDSTNRLRHNRTNGGSWTNTESASEIQISDITFADDMLLFFDTSTQVRTGTPALMELINRFGAAFHVSETPTGKSKSVCMYVPAHDRHWEHGNTNPIPVGNHGWVAFVRYIKYLGSIISYDLDQKRELDCRAGSFCGKVRRFARFLGNRSLSIALRRQVVRVCVDTSMMYGLESLALGEAELRLLAQKQGHMLQKLRNTNRYAMHNMHLSYEDIRRQFKIASVCEQVMRRKLGFVLKLIKLKNPELPERMLIGGILKHDTSDTDHSDSGAWNADACGHMYPSDGRPYTRTFDGSVAKMLEYRAMQLWRYAILNGRPLKPEFEVKPYIAQMFHYYGEVNPGNDTDPRGNLRDKPNNKYYWGHLLKADRWERVVRYGIFERPEGTKEFQRNHRQNNFAATLPSDFIPRHGGINHVRHLMRNL